MAVMHTPLRGTETDGERHLYELLDQKLGNTFHMWHSIVEPRTHKEIDFLLLHPKYGLWVIEVKDWLINQLLRIDAENCRLMMNGVEVEQRNPVRQARENHYPIRNLLSEEASLLHATGRFEGNLLFPVHHIVVFSNMSREEMTQRDIYRLFPEHQLMTADIIHDPSLDTIALENLLIEKRSPRFLNHRGLEDTQITAIDRIFKPSATLSPESESWVSVQDQAAGQAIQDLSAADDNPEAVTETDPGAATDRTESDISQHLVPDAFTPDLQDAGDEILPDDTADLPVASPDEAMPIPDDSLAESAATEAPGAADITDEPHPPKIRQIVSYGKTIPVEVVDREEEEVGTENEMPPRIEAAPPLEDSALIDPLFVGTDLPLDYQRKLAEIIAINRQLLQNIWRRN